MAEILATRWGVAGIFNNNLYSAVCLRSCWHSGMRMVLRNEKLELANRNSRLGDSARYCCSLVENRGLHLEPGVEAEKIELWRGGLGCNAVSFVESREIRVSPSRIITYLLP